MPGPVRWACLSSIWGLYLRIYYTPVCATLEGVPMGPLRKPEVMSPAGYWPQLRAAIEAGADAVYFGLKHFTARAKVGFSLAELPEVMATLHRRGVKGYITFNTLVFNHELDEAARALGALAEAGADALIVQDVGVAPMACAWRRASASARSRWRASCRWSRCAPSARLPIASWRSSCTARSAWRIPASRSEER